MHLVSVSRQPHPTIPKKNYGDTAPNPNWIGIDIEINKESLDLNTCKAVKNFRRVKANEKEWLRADENMPLKNKQGNSIKWRYGYRC